jgi:cell division protein FtsB
MYKILPILFILFYFIVHIITGNRGLISNKELVEEITQKEAILTRLQEERKALEDKIDKVSLETLDQDFLDELARKELGLSDPQEKVLLLP